MLPDRRLLSADRARLSRSQRRHRSLIDDWIMFTAANVATVSYALVISRDAIVAAIFALNAFGAWLSPS